MEIYSFITDYLKEAGSRIKEKAGNIVDIGIKKSYLTEEDLRIERELTDIIHTHFPDHALYAEEEHGDFPAADNIWVIDPISGTAPFIAGLPHYSLVVTHLYKNQPVFAAVYDPSVNELFTAEKGKGSFLNGKRLSINQTDRKIIFKICRPKRGSIEAEILLNAVVNFDISQNENSDAVNYCWVAAGKYGGFVTLAKDIFPECAGMLIIEEAGGVFTSATGVPGVDIKNKLWIGGNESLQEPLKMALENTLSTLVS